MSRSATPAAELPITNSSAEQETQPTGKPVEPKSSSPGSTEVPESPAPHTSQPPAVQPQPRRSRFKRNAQTPIAGELPSPVLSPTVPASVWNGPTYPAASSNDPATGKTSDSIRPSRAQRVMAWSRSYWRLLASVALVAFGSISFILLRKRAKREAALRPKYPRWSDEKIGPSYEPRNYAPKPGQRRSIVDELDLRELFDDESVPGEASSESFLDDVETVETSSEAVGENSTDVAELEPALVQREIGNLLAGKDFDANVIGAQNRRTRKTIETALLSVLSGRDFNQHEPARKALFDFNYFDDLTARLRTAESERDREAAARLLGLVRDPRASAHLVVSLRDPSPGVRRAAVESIGQIGDPAAVASLRELLKRESGRELPEAVIKHAINSITVAQAKRAELPVDTTSPFQTEPTTSAYETRDTAPPKVLSSEESSSESEPSIASTEVKQSVVELPEPIGLIDEQNLSAESRVDDVEFEKQIEKFQSDPSNTSTDESANVSEPSLKTQVIVAHEEGLHEAELLVSEAEKRRLFEADELRHAEQELQKAIEEVAQRRLLVEEARRKAEAETQSLSEMADQIRADEESRRQIEIDLQNLKLQAQSRLEEERLKFEEARRSVVEEQQRLSSELTRLFSEEQDRLSSLELEKQRAEAELQQRAELEKRLKAGIEDLYAAGAEQRGRIEVAAQHRAELDSSLKAEQVHEDVEDAKPTADNLPPQHSEDIYAEHVEQRPNLPHELLERLRSSSSEDRAHALHELSELGGETAFMHITEAFDDTEVTVRNAAAIALHNLEGDRTATFTRALKESDSEKRRAIGAAIASSGLAQEMIPKLTAESREDTYDSFSLLFLMARAGEPQPLFDAISNSSNVGVQLAVVKLLTLTGQPEIVPALESLTIHQSLSPEVKSALKNAIEELGGQTDRTVSSVA